MAPALRYSQSGTRAGTFGLGQVHPTRIRAIIRHPAPSRSRMSPVEMRRQRRNPAVSRFRAAAMAPAAAASAQEIERALYEDDPDFARLM